MDRKEKEKLFIANYNAIVWSVRKFVNAYKLVDYEDALQQGCLIVWEHICNYDPSKGSMSTFINVNIKNYLGNYIKGKKNVYKLIYCPEILESKLKVPGIEVDDSIDDKYAPFGHYNNITPEVELLNYSQPDELVLKALNELKISDRDRNIFMERFGYGKYLYQKRPTFDELAEKYKISKQAASAIIQRIRAKLINIKYLSNYLYP